MRRAELLRVRFADFLMMPPLRCFLFELFIYVPHVLPFKVEALFKSKIQCPYSHYIVMLHTYNESDKWMMCISCSSRHISVSEPSSHRIFSYLNFIGVTMQRAASEKPL